MMLSRHAALITEEERGILRALLYFDLFQYPLTEAEIRAFSTTPLSGDWASALVHLCDRQWIFKQGDFHSLKENSFRIGRRIAGNERARQSMVTAHRMSRWIAHIPFVRAIMLSGSISKGYMDINSDIDYFIITAPNRLWLVRTTLAIIRRVFMFNSHRYLCTNYFIDDQHLEITEKNMFTAVETKTLVPMYGGDVISRFRRANGWISSYLPQSRLESLPPESTGWLKILLEHTLPDSWFTRIDRWLLNKGTQYWKGRYASSLTDQDFSIAFESTPHVSRSHPEFYQKKIIKQYNSAVLQLEQQLGISLEA
jgi:hypothetical protein